MGFNDILKALFGNKSTRDLKKLVPMVDKIKAVYPEIEKLSNDELRARIDEVRSRLKESVAGKKAEIAELKEEIEKTDYENREPLWDRIDKLEKEILDILEKYKKDGINRYKIKNTSTIEDSTLYHMKVMLEKRI